jgi:hypothetical protein
VSRVPIRFVASAGLCFALSADPIFFASPPSRSRCRVPIRFVCSSLSSLQQALPSIPRLSIRTRVVTRCRSVSVDVAPAARRFLYRQRWTSMSGLSLCWACLGSPFLWRSSVLRSSVLWVSALCSVAVSSQLLLLPWSNAAQANRFSDRMWVIAGWSQSSLESPD